MDNRDILEAISSGQKHFACAGSTVGDLAVFQSVVGQITELEARGLIYGIQTKRESFTGQRYVSVVSVDQITDAGLDLLGKP